MEYDSPELSKQNPTVPMKENSLGKFIDKVEKSIQNGDNLGIPDVKKQITSLKEFNEGKMTYAEMRARCG